MKPVVFAGPSIYGISDNHFSELDLRPPAASGDILGAVEGGARIIGLIDGLYGDCAAVWHKEILYAISKGVIVAGAASMGALRAAECNDFGMIGLGEIYKSYKSGQRVSDADVAVSHAPSALQFRPLTTALVDAEATILKCEQHLDPAKRDLLLGAARRVHFARRTWRSIATEAGLGDVHTLLAANAVSIKRHDATRLLVALANGDFLPGGHPNFKLQNTMFFDGLFRRHSPDGPPR